MPKCIFCDNNVPHSISKEKPEKSFCLDCLVELKRFEMQNFEEIMHRIFPDRVLEAMKRLKHMDTSQMPDPDKQAQMLRDLNTAQEILPF
jgi:hypothetical protein